VNSRSWPCLALVLLLAGCALPQRVPTGPATSTSVTLDPGPVVLTLGGQGAAQCQFTLFARYPENLVPHTIDLRSRVTSNTTDFSNEAGMYVELPMLGVDWTEATPAGMLTAITNGSAEEGCGQLQGLVVLKDCLGGNCPRYVADEHSAIPLTIQ
jgi:hypothetical protein